jgi:hypothetical protein
MPDRRDNAELGKVCSDRIDHRGLLTDKHMAYAVKHQAALPLRRFCWHEHVGSGDRLAIASASAMSFFCHLT